MRQITSWIIGLVAVATPALWHVQAQGRLDGRGADRRFVSQRYGFSIAVPSAWNVSVQKDTPMYVNFSSSAGLSQLTLPPGGASIVVVARDTLPSQGRLGRTLSQWAEGDAKEITTNPPSATPFEMPRESGVLGALTCSYDVATFSPDEQPQHSVSVYWEFKGKQFAAHLTYVVNERNAAMLERTFAETVRSIRPIESGRLP
jgi:hypothetical protein